MAKENGKGDAAAPTKPAADAAHPTPALLPHCGIVMPISELDTLPAAHWAEVKSILIDAIEAAGFSADLVSEAEDVGTIHKRIIQHLYEDPVVVCDVSGKNANVMFELGLRLAFDKPTIIVKDSKTGYSFDTSPIEHITYPRDLRFAQVVEFKKELGAKVRATFEAGKKPEYSTFLKHFGPFTVAKLDTEEVSKDQFFLEQLAHIEAKIDRLDRSRNPLLESSEKPPLLSKEGVRIRAHMVIARLRNKGDLPPPVSTMKLVDHITDDIWRTANSIPMTIGELDEFIELTALGTYSSADAKEEP